MYKQVAKILKLNMMRDIGLIIANGNKLIFSENELIYVNDCVG